MRITRTANAGVLLELDGTKLLLDGVCREVSPYPATPSHIRQSLLQSPPDLVAVTHFHDDHCDPDFEKAYESATGRQVITPDFAGKTLQIGNITLSVIPSRHIGKADCNHVSYWIRGSIDLLFTGDAAPMQWKKNMPAADVLLAPFAYASTEAAWRVSREIAPKVVLLHFPELHLDSLGLRAAVLQTVGGNNGIFIPEMEEFVEINF